MGKIENNRSLKILSVAALIGTVVLGTPAIAGVNNSHPEVVSGANKQGAVTGFAADVVLGTDESAEVLKNKPVDTPTLDYLHQNNVLIPQKGEYNKTDKTWSEADPIEAPESAYKITAGTEADHTFDYTTADKDGNLTHNYYKVELKQGHSELGSESPNFGTSDHIEWKKLETAPAEGTPNTISIKVSDTETLYYSYEYTKPSNYEETSTRIDNTLTTENSQYKVFKDKTATSSHGGAIYNSKDKSTVDIIADFINNSATSTSYWAHGGAIYNYKNSTIGNITGDFINNSANSTTREVIGGAIYNNGTIGNITGDFINNSATATGYSAFAYGGAIYNGDNATIGDITGNFINNSATGSSSAYGGAIYNSGTIGNITGDFINNSATSSNSSASGGAISNNYGTIGNITGDFINNSVSSTGSSDSGGAISNNSGTIGNITGDFINNSASSTGSSAKGGAIYNYNGKIGNITGDFINNSATGSSASGGAIYNSNGKIGNITGDFINNSASSTGSSAYGGAIYNYYGTIGNITGDFINNSATGSSYAFGGAICNYDTIGNITGDFINNSATGSSSAYGGAIYNSGTIGNITGDFINNSATGSSSAYGGAIYNSGTIGNITGDFINNSASSTGYSASGGAIYNNAGTIGNITGDFINNSATSTSSSYSSYVYGGAIYNTGTIGAKDSDGNVIGGIINSNFIGNFAKSESGTSQGGAIYSTTDLNIIADGATSTFKDNYTQVSEEKDDNAIYLDNVDGTLNFQLKNNGQIAMYDNIRGKYTETTETDEAGNEITKITDTYKVTIQGDGTNTTFHLLNDIYNANVSMGNTTINTLNNLTHTYNFNSLTLTGDTNFIADVDLANAEMDRFTAASYGEHQGNLNVVGMNLLSDATSDKTEVFFAEQGLKNNVTTNVKELSGYTPIYKYNVIYNNKPDGGYFVFQRGSNGGNPSEAFNPAVLSSPVATAAATQATVNETFKYVFEHADAFTQLPSVERISRINLNKYALNQEKYNGYSTDYNTNLGSLNPTLNNKAGWFRPYVTFENMHLNHGPKVNAITYGSLVGYDTDFKKHKHGWYSVGTGYIGYNGSQLNYSNTDTTMNGGLLGYTHTFYKGNFWSALTATAGASVGESKSMYGKENFTTLLAGIGSKTGYNFEFKKGKFIVQPIMFMSYTFANTFDYTNAAGVKINNSPAHSIQLNPSVRFIANTKTGWQPYASVGMVWNVMNENKVTANNVRLPEMSMKPYVEYGLGLQRNWKDKFTAFGQAMIRNGGRNGIALTAGFRWSLGKDSKPIEKVNNETLKRVQGDKGVNVKKLTMGNPSMPNIGGKVPTTANRTVLKQLTPTQKTDLGPKPQNTTRTTNSAILKQL